MVPSINSHSATLIHNNMLVIICQGYIIVYFTYPSLSLSLSIPPTMALYNYLCQVVGIGWATVEQDGARMKRIDLISSNTMNLVSSGRAKTSTTSLEIPCTPFTHVV